MKRLGVVAAVAALGAGACQSAVAPPRASEPLVSTQATTESVTGGLAGLPLSFIPNRGQIAGATDYYVQGSGASVGFDAGGVSWVLGQELIETRFVGTPGAEPEGLHRGPGVVSYFKGDPDEWHTRLPTFERVAYRDLWPGIDLIYSGDADEVKYAFRVSPGADLSDVRLAYRGADSVALNEAGQLEVSAGAERLTDDAPVSWQPGPEGRTPVPTSYDLRGSTYGFDLDGYDPSRPLVIDPAVLVYAGYIGGSATDTGNGIAVDGSGAAYVTGEVSSTESTFPETGGPDLFSNGVTDAFVAKVNPSGTALVYAGYIGGTGGDFGNGIAVDADGAAYVVGRTDSTATSFPVTGGPDITHNGGGNDAFVVKVDPDGLALDYAGYIGGSGTDFGRGIAVDGSGNAYVIGETASAEATFPDGTDTGSDGDAFDGIPGPDQEYNGGFDVFVAKVGTSGAALDYAGYVGGASFDAGYGIAVDSLGAAYLTGETNSDDVSFPETGGPDLDENGVSDAFVAKVNTGGTALDYAGYIGGSGQDFGRGIAVDTAGAAYVTGYTASSEATFPETVGPDLVYNLGTDAFVAKVNTSGATLAFAGYIGGSGSDNGFGIAVDSSGAAYVTGETFSTEATFPVTGGPDVTHNGGGNQDAYVAKVNPSGGALVYAGYIGGSGSEGGHGIAVDASGAAYVTGYATSTEATFPETGGPDLTHNGMRDVFVAKVAEAAAVTKTVTLAGKKKVKKGKKAKLTAVVGPCPGTAGDTVDLYRKGNVIRSGVTDASCTVVFKVKMNKTATFQAVSPQDDPLQLEGASNTLKVKVKKVQT
jgi:hypothetical protein